MTIPLDLCVDWLLENMAINDGARSAGLPHLSVRVGSDVCKARTYANLRQLVTAAVERVVGSWHQTHTIM